MENQIFDRSRNLIYQRRLRDSASPLAGWANLYYNYMENKNSSSSNSNNWGGARQGAGRPKKVKGKIYAFTSTPDVDAFLSTYEGNRAAFINEAILHYINSK